MGAIFEFTGIGARLQETTTKRSGLGLLFLILGRPAVCNKLHGVVDEPLPDGIGLPDLGNK
jgi:hypothetical protein